ncbi:LapA family protein [Streptomyces sp. RY43-2]|uniref:LapA family protein n=1 Tax=Streptomyces macrolidinus TaxID=2952607 RepID=A0ABT0ZGE2_9ACTN|nr:LapA family protein [Streptomyces macrolidinus]MCN9242660.1 LapA family protein [Streptomyces macrolidinus]
MRARTPSGEARQGRLPWVTPRRIAGLALAALVLAFVFENTQHTRIRLLVATVTMPLWLALLGTGVIGALCGALVMSRRG